MSDDKHETPEAAHDDHGAPVPKFLLLVYLVIAGFFAYYLFTGLRFGAGSPTGF